LTLSILDSLRDCATHHLLDLTEQALYVHAQAAVTLYDKVLQASFGDRLADHLPSRVLPISAEPPTDMLTFLDAESSQIQALLAPGKRRKAEARGRLRHLMIIESNISGTGEQPSDKEVDRALRRVKQGETWQSLFPATATLHLDTRGHGPSVSIRLTREAGAAPVRVVRPGEPGADEAILVREVDLLDRYSMGLTQLANNMSLSTYDTQALIYQLRLRDDPECCHEFRIGGSRFRRYSPRAQERLLQAKEAVNMTDVRSLYKQRTLNRT